jgi:hypothetical protein
MTRQLFMKELSEKRKVKNFRTPQYFQLFYVFLCSKT